MTENPGGVETFLMNAWRHFDPSRIRLDFLCNSHKPIAFEDELLSNGVRTFHITSRRQNPVRFYREIHTLFQARAKEWDSVWVNVSSLANIDYLKLAKQYGVARRIIHSHNTRNMDGKLRGVLHAWNKRIIGRYATDFWACSQDAAEWFYGGTGIKEVRIIRNAIDIDRMACDGAAARALRENLSLGIDGGAVIGNIGRLHFQKNQMFALEVFSAFIKKGNRAKLVLVGQGEDENKLKARCVELGIADSVLFMGIQKDIRSYLSAFDVLLFPSLFEGMSVAALEAQANGVPVLASETAIPPEGRLNANVRVLRLEEGPRRWAAALTDMIAQAREPAAVVRRNFEQNGFEISTEAKKLEALLLEQ